MTFDSFDAIDDEQLRRTFDTNILAMFWLTQAALPHLQPGSAIVNVASIQANGEVLGVTGSKPLS